MQGTRSTREWRWIRTWEHRVEWAETMKRHVTHPAIITRWFQECRIEGLYYSIFPGYGRNTLFVAAENTVELLRPIPLYQRIAVRTALDYVGSSSVVFYYQVDSLPENDPALSSSSSSSSSSKGAQTTITFATGTCRLVHCDSAYTRKVLSPEDVEALKSLGARVLPPSALPPKDILPTNANTWPFCWQYEVLNRDLDANVHLNNCAVFHLLEEARFKYIEKLQEKLKTEFNDAQPTTTTTTTEAAELANLEWYSYRVLYFRTVLLKEILNIRVRVEAVHNDALHFAFYLTTGTSQSATPAASSRPCHYATARARYKGKNNKNNTSNTCCPVPPVVLSAIESMEGKKLPSLDRPEHEHRGNKL
jgi:acyl-CoA thioesterase FadM